MPPDQPGRKAHCQVDYSPGPTEDVFLRLEAPSPKAAASVCDRPVVTACEGLAIRSAGAATTVRAGS